MKKSKPRGDSNVVMFTSLSLILLAFFILLYALSSPKSKTKRTELAFEIKRAFQSVGGLFADLGDSAETGRGRTENTLEVSSQVEALVSELNTFVEADESLEEFSYEVREEALVLQIPTDFSFEADSAQLTSKAEPFLNKIFEMIVQTENQVRVEGHSDDLPLESSPYASHWELSAARANQVLLFFVNKKIVPEVRFSAAGYGDSRPMATNRFSEGRAKNRRITLNIIGAVRSLGGPLGTGK